MVAAEFESEIITVCAAAYDPPAGDNVGVATGRLIVYAAVLTALVATPVALEFAIALIVSVDDTVTGPE
jgi:hypothetical protein